MAIDKAMPRVDVEKCIETFDGQMYAMILVAAARAREIQNKKNFTERNSQSLIRTGYKPVNAALDEILQGRLTVNGVVK